MLTPQYLLPLHRELVIDLFAGGGGASTGIEQAIGRPVDIAIDHDPVAVSLHQVTRDIAAPLNTVTASSSPAAVAQAFLTAYYGSEADGQSLHEPARTAPTHDRFALVVVKGQPYYITDIGLRMLTPRELFCAQGFDDGYIIDRGADGKPLTKTEQVRLCGNSVCPPIARAIVAANYTDAALARRAA